MNGPNFVPKKKIIYTKITTFHFAQKFAKMESIQELRNQF